MNRSGIHKLRTFSLFVNIRKRILILLRVLCINSCLLIPDPGFNPGVVRMGFLA
jgi:hypothetical protein